MSMWCYKVLHSMIIAQSRNSCWCAEIVRRIHQSQCHVSHSFPRSDVVRRMEIISRISLIPCVGFWFFFDSISVVVQNNLTTPMHTLLSRFKHFRRLFQVPTFDTVWLLFPYHRPNQKQSFSNCWLWPCRVAVYGCKHNVFRLYPFQQ